MYWEKIKSEIKGRYEYFLPLFAHFNESSSFSEIPHVLQISSALASDMAAGESEFRRLSFLFPRSFDSALWIAVCSSLAMLRGDFLPAVEQIPPFSKGQKLLLDNKYVVEFDGEENFNGQRFMWMKFKEQKDVPFSRKTFPLRERLRFQPTTTNRQLSVYNKIPSPPAHPLDQILKIQTYGNRAIFCNRVILVSFQGRTREFAAKIHLGASMNDEKGANAGVPLMNLFQWGNIDSEGLLKPWHHHQVEAEPILAVASDLLSVREYLRSGCKTRPLVILDGSSSFSRDLDALDEVLDTACPFVAVTERGEEESVKLLTDRSFGIWVWTEKEIQLLDSPERKRHPHRPGSPFSLFNRSLRNYARREIEEILCDDAVIQSAAEKLEALNTEMEPGRPDLEALVATLYRCLLPVARLVRPVRYTGQTDWKLRIERRIQKAESDLSRNAIWLSDTVADTVNRFLKDLKEILSAGESAHAAKMDALREIIMEPGKGTVSVVLGDVEESSLATNYWKMNLDGGNSVHFCSTSTMSDVAFNFKRMVICGWLGTAKMRQIMDSCLTPGITVLTYPFEMTWLRSAMRRWKRDRINGLGITEKAQLLNVDTTDLPAAETDVREKEAAGEPEGTFDISEFELRLRTYRRTAMAKVESSGEGTADARFIEFSEDRFAFLTGGYRVPVITDLFTGKAGESDEIPRKTVSELKIGDYVIFREGSQGDLIREIADQGLEKAGKGHLREVAGLWKMALRGFEEKALRLIMEKYPSWNDKYDPGDASFIVAEFLKEKGCNRHPQTIRNWLTDDDMIGPRSFNDLQIITEVTADTELTSRLHEVRRAIKEVRGAHLQASHFLATRLINALPGHIAGAVSGALTVDIEGIGKATVARVEYIGDELTPVGTTRVNRLLQEED